ncbi:MAG: hypothetical protein AAF492_11010, partial [Verrucomicrobiota bacterium]
MLWGPTDGGTNLLGWSNRVVLGTFTNPASTNFSLPISGLTSNQMHWFTLLATNCAESLWAAPAGTFATKGPPRIENIGVTNVHIGGVWPQVDLVAGGVADVSIFWGDNDGGTNKADWDNELQLGAQLMGPGNGSISGLLYGACYVYRAYATNSCGEAWASSSVSFVSFPPQVLGLAGLTARQYDAESGADEFTPISVLQNKTEDGRNIQTGNITYGNFVGAFNFITANTTFSLLWEGAFVPSAGFGAYSFGLDSDDYSVLVLDRNQDGDFDNGAIYDPGELVVDRPCCGATVTQTMLDDRPYRIAIGYEQGPGGARLTARWLPGAETVFGNLNLLNPGAGSFFTSMEDAFGISNLPPVSVTDTSAVLNARLMSPDSVFYVSAYWNTLDAGTNAALWTNTAFIGAFTNVTATNLSLMVSMLATNTEYFYTFRATNCATERWSPVSRFRTRGAPAIDTTGATSLGLGSATLNGALTNGGVASVRFYYGLADGGTASSAWDAVVGIGPRLEGPVSAQATGLLYGVPYFYRAFATNQNGMAWAPTASTFKSTVPFGSARRGFQVRVYDTVANASFMNPISNLFGEAEEGIFVYDDLVDFNNYADYASAFPTLTAPDTFSVLFDGYMFIGPGDTGTYSFGTASDDGSMVYFDLNDDGDFVDAGEIVVDNNGLHGRLERLGTATFPTPGCYRMVFAMFENGGAENLEVKYRRGTGWNYNELDFIDLRPPSTQPFFLSC